MTWLPAMNTNLFYGALLLAAAAMAAIALAEPLFGPLFEGPAAQDLLRSLIRPVAGLLG